MATTKTKTKSNNLPIAALAERQGLRPNREAFTFRSGEVFSLALSNGTPAGRFSMRPISGVPFRHPYWGNFVIDTESLKFKSQKFPILREHQSTRIVGWSDSAKTEKGAAVVEGTFSKVTSDGKEVAELALEGFPWEASVLAVPSSIEWVKEGAEVKVNGHTIKGPGAVFRGTLIEECSFCAIGADPRTKVRTFSGAETEQEIIHAFSAEAVNQKEAAMPDPIMTETPAPAAAPAPATFSQADLDARVQAAIRADRESRTKLSADIRALAAPGQEKLAQDLIDGGKTLDQAKDAILSDLKAKLGQKVDTFHRDPGAGIVPRQASDVAPSAANAPAQADEKAIILGGGLIDEVKAKAKFAADPEIRKEFFGSESAYLALLRAESRGEVTSRPPKD